MIGCIFLRGSEPNRTKIVGMTVLLDCDDFANVKVRLITPFHHHRQLWEYITLARPRVLPLHIHTIENVASLIAYQPYLPPFELRCEVCVSKDPPLNVRKSLVSQ